MPQETRPMRPEDGFPISHLNLNVATVSKLADSPGVNQSYYITGFVLSGAYDGNGFSFLRRAALTFGTSDVFTVTHNVALEPVEADFAIVFGIKTSSVALDPLIHKWDAGASTGYKIAVTSAGKLEVIFKEGSNTATITSRTRVDDDVLHQVIITWEYQAVGEDGLNLYIDGESVADAVDNTGVGSITETGESLLITGTSDSKLFYISTLALYKTQILSTDEIAALWNGGVGHKFIGDETGLSAAWNLDEGDTESVYVNVKLPGTYNGAGTGTPTYLDGEGFPIDPHTLKQSITYAAGVMEDSATSPLENFGIVPIAVVNFPHAIKIGRNNPIRIKETDGGFGLELYGFKGSYA